MHVMGKVAVWLVVLAAAASSVLTAKLIEVRNSWTKKSVDFQNQYRALLPKIAEAEEQLAALEAERFRATGLWGYAWAPTSTSIKNPADGTVVADIGTNNGVKEKQWMYGFEIQPDNTVIYRGDFTVVLAAAGQSELKPNWRVRPEEVQAWQQKANWRWRNLLASGYQDNFDQKVLAIYSADNVLTERKKTLATQVKLEAQAQEHLKLREAELVGGDQLSKDEKVAVEYREGLVAAVEQTEEIRNQVLLKVDELRRRVRAVQHDVDRLQAENVELTGKLPQPGPATVTRKD
jgi:hypothetical protein